MKITNLSLMAVLSFVGFVSAHTGNDMYDHGMTVYEGVIGGLVVVALVLLIVYLIKQIKKK